MDNSIFMVAVPSELLSLPMVPKKWASIAQVTEDLQQYIIDILNEEKNLLDQDKPATGSLMTLLVRASESQRKASEGPKALTTSEILGNVFVINFAGHDTTANALAYAMMLLAAYPEVQEWIGQELKILLAKRDIEAWSNKDLFPRLKRCQAVLLETIRLYPPIMALPKTTHGHAQTLKISGGNILIPPHTFVVPSLLAVYTYPKYWQPNPMVWRPSRGITSNAPGTTDLSGIEMLELEELIVPRKGTYFPWSDGPQYCPGKKFAQVEFVAVLTYLLRNHRVYLLAREGGNKEKGRREALAVCEDSEHVLLLRMRDGDTIRLV